MYAWDDNAGVTLHHVAVCGTCGYPCATAVRPERCPLGCDGRPEPKLLTQAQWDAATEAWAASLSVRA